MRRSVEQRLDQHDRCREAANGERQKAADLVPYLPAANVGNVELYW